MRRRSFAMIVFVMAVAWTPRAHDITTTVTWNREVFRIVQARCASCHRAGGEAFSLLDFREANPWSAAIKDAVLARDMPPWGAVKGFGNFRNERALSQEEIDLIVSWVDGGSPEGNPDHLPAHLQLPPDDDLPLAGGGVEIGGDYRFPQAFMLDAFVITRHPADASTPITIAFPDGRIEPLVWPFRYDDRLQHPFLLRAPLALPAGATIRGLPPSSRLVLFSPAATH